MRLDEKDVRDAVRFWRKCEIGGLDDCWPWSAGKTGGGYGVFSIRGRSVYAHRVAYERLHGPLPADLHIDHACLNRLCVNPWHLEAVTPTVNKRRAVTGRTGWTVKVDRPAPTHCLRGHPLTPDNATPGKPGQARLKCRVCDRERKRLARANS